MKDAQRYYIIIDEDGDHVYTTHSVDDVDELMAEFRFPPFRVLVSDVLDGEYEIFRGTWDFSDPSWRKVSEIRYDEIHRI